MMLSAAGFTTVVRAQVGAVPAAQAAAVAPAPAAGTPEAARVYWTGNRSECRNCHGAAGEGGFGPDLAGRGLNADQFRRAVRQPWGVMPAYVATQISDADIDGLTAYFAGMPKVGQPGPWVTTAPANAPAPQLALITAGCGQCHGADLGNPRTFAGAEGGDWAWFAKKVYDHTSDTPMGRMGNFSRLRLPESTLQEIWHYASVDLGLRAQVRSQVAPGVLEGGNTTYTITVTNSGVAGKGLAAEDLTVSVTVPAGSTVVSTSTNGYQGAAHDAGANTDAAVWTAPRIAAGDRIVYTLTVSGTPAAPPRGQVRWTKPTVDAANIGGGRGGGPAGAAAPGGRGAGAPPAGRGQN
jgi:mono/diheme cytochrome c family protein